MFYHWAPYGHTESVVQPAMDINLFIFMAFFI